MIENTRFAANRAPAGGGACWFSGERMTARMLECKGNYSDGGKGGVLLFRGRTLSVSEFHALENSASGIGGVIDFEGDSAFIEKSTLYGNTSGECGGGIRFLGKELVVRNTSFAQNTAQRLHGGACNFEGFRCAMIQCTFLDNQAQGTGGAIAFRGEELVCAGSKFTGNSSRKNGGAIDFQGDSCQIDTTEFRNNVSVQGNGGAVTLTGKLFKIVKASFEHNKAQTGGALFCNTDIHYLPGQNNRGLSVEFSAFTRNSASGSGGALSWMGSGTIKGCRFESNSASYGGAVHGWVHATGRKILFRGDSVVVDKKRVDDELQDSRMARISHSSFRENVAEIGSVSASWTGTFEACGIIGCKSEDDTCFAPGEYESTIYKPDCIDASMGSTGGFNGHERKIVSR